MHASRRAYAITLRKAHSFMLGSGFSSVDLLARTEIAEAELADPYHLVSEDQARLYYANLIRLADRDGVGLEIGWMTSLSDMGPHGMALTTERTLADALRKTWELRFNYNLLIDWEYDVTDKVLIHRLWSKEPETKLRIFLLERGLATIQVHTEELLGRDMKPLRVLLDYPAPGNIEQYKEIFSCPLRFSQPHTELHFSAEWLNNPLETYDPQAVDMLSAFRANLHEKLASGGGGDIVQDVKMALRRTPGEFPSLERIAEGLAMSSRTLRRKLGQHGVRYQDLLDEERRRVAEDFLLNTDLSIQQVADHCGFTDAQNFSQAFRRWQGMSPTEFRRTKGPDTH